MTGRRQAVAEVVDFPGFDDTWPPGSQGSGKEESMPRSKWWGGRCPLRGGI